MSSKHQRLAARLSGEGIEIGALSHPLQTPPGAHVTYVDRLPVETLREHYPELEAEPLTPVDVLGSAEDLRAFADGSLDFVIANHVFEHLERPIHCLAEFHRVLRPGGILYLALPDRRQTFDRERALTTSEHLFQEYEAGSEGNRWAHYMDWAVNVDHRPQEEAEAHARRLMGMDYSIHFHVWEPDTFLDFLLEVRRRLGLDLQVLEFSAPESENDNEFILILARRQGDRVVVLPEPAPASPDTAIGERLSRRAWRWLPRRLRSAIS